MSAGAVSPPAPEHCPRALPQSAAPSGDGKNGQRTEVSWQFAVQFTLADLEGQKNSGETGRLPAWLAQPATSARKLERSAPVKAPNGEGFWGAAQRDLSTIRCTRSPSDQQRFQTGEHKLPGVRKEPTGAAIQGRDRDVWAAFYDAHVRDVYAVVWRLVNGNQALAEELHQAVWLSAIESAPSFDPKRGTVQSWLIGIARNQVALHFRRQSMQRAGVANLADSRPAVVHHGPSAADQASLRSEQLCQVQTAMAQLTNDRRQLIEGKYIEGLSVRQLAERSGKSDKAVESLLQRARSELRQLLNRSAK